jgi:hypothetical protein
MAGNAAILGDTKKPLSGKQRPQSLAASIFEKQCKAASSKAVPTIASKGVPTNLPTVCNHQC